MTLGLWYWETFATIFCQTLLYLTWINNVLSDLKQLKHMAVRGDSSIQALELSRPGD